jgi:chorismate-pyruvate lyase
MIRQIRFVLNGHTLVQARAEVDLVNSSSVVVKLLKETNTPIGEIVRKYKVRRTRLRSTTRTREFHFIGDLKAKIWERFYVPKTKSPIV